MNDRDQLLAAVERKVLAWPGVSKEPGRFNSTAFVLGRREIGHVHRNGVADFGFPRSVRDELIASGQAEPHQAGVPSAASYYIREPEDVPRVVALFRLGYDRARSAADGGDRPEPTPSLSPSDGEWRDRADPYEGAPWPDSPVHCTCIANACSVNAPCVDFGLGRTTI